MLTLFQHPCIIFHDSGYSLFTLPFRQSQIESSIALHHNALLDSLSNCPQGSVPHLTPPHLPPVRSFSNGTPPHTSQHTHPDSVTRRPPSPRVPQSSSSCSSSRSIKTHVARKKLPSANKQSSLSDSDSDYEEVPSNLPSKKVSFSPLPPRTSPRLRTSPSPKSTTPPYLSGSNPDVQSSPSTILDDLSWDPTADGRIHIKLSEVSPDAGKGAFASIAIDIDDTICSYYGDPRIRLTPKQAQSPKYVSDYVLVIDHIAVDAQDRKTLKILSGAGYINEAFDEHLANCVFKRIGNRIVVVATRDIKPGEELLILYGETYWRTSRWSLALLKKAAQHYSHASSAQLWSDLIFHAEEREKHRLNPELAIDSLSAQRRADSLLPILPLKHPWVITPLPMSNFKYGSWNVGSDLSNASTGSEKLDSIHKFFLSSGMSCLFLLDIR
jgi:hypothetical protein